MYIDLLKRMGMMTIYFVEVFLNLYLQIYLIWSDTLMPSSHIFGRRFLYCDPSLGC